MNVIHDLNTVTFLCVSVHIFPPNWTDLLEKAAKQAYSTMATKQLSTWSFISIANVLDLFCLHKLQSSWNVCWSLTFLKSCGLHGFHFNTPVQSGKCVLLGEFRLLSRIMTFSILCPHKFSEMDAFIRLNNIDLDNQTSNVSLSSNLSWTFCLF